jgi:hypothetical protein
VEAAMPDQRTRLELAEAKANEARLARALYEYRQWIDATVANCSVFSAPPQLVETTALHDHKEKPQ